MADKYDPDTQSISDPESSSGLSFYSACSAFGSDPEHDLEAGPSQDTSNYHTVLEITREMFVFWIVTLWLLLSAAVILCLALDWLTVSVSKSGLLALFVAFLTSMVAVVVNFVCVPALENLQGHE
ncbi:hypothetical protein BDW62DRAFT_199186 [Aspergillus aurantiobrunneus]